MMLDPEQYAGLEAALAELERQRKEGDELFYERCGIDVLLDGHLDLPALVCAVLEAAQQARARAGAHESKEETDGDPGHQVR